MVSGTPLCMLPGCRLFGPNSHALCVVSNILACLVDTHYIYAFPLKKENSYLSTKKHIIDLQNYSKLHFSAGSSVVGKFHSDKLIPFVNGISETPNVGLIYVFV